MNSDAILVKTGPWLHVMFATASDTCNLVWSLRQRTVDRTVSLKIRGKKSRDMSSMFNEFSAVLQFPYYFGENWNALDECLNDLEWLPADNYVIFITDANHLLVDETPDDFRAIVSALEQAGQEWSDVRGKPFHV